MRVLFVSSGNAKFRVSPIIKNQGESLIKNKIGVDFYPLRGKGIRGYIKNIFKLKKYLRNNHYDIIHAHYNLSAYTASLAGADPQIVSLMGSDVNSGAIINLISKLFYFFSWNKIIVKSDDMAHKLGVKNYCIIPNGVDLKKINPLEKEKSRISLNNSIEKKQILFAANSKRKEKNFSLARISVNKIKSENIELRTLSGVPSEKMPIYYNAADLLLLTSNFEGSPNVIKEAMACNTPIVSTNVGDVKWVLGDTEGCYITSFEPDDIANKIEKALEFARTKGQTNGRERIIKLGLDSDSIANKIIKVYKEVLDLK